MFQKNVKFNCKIMEATNLPKNANGVKLPYFHRTLSEEDKSLIGDTTPKRLEGQPPESNAAIPSSSSSTASAWNGASTWEEKNVFTWAKDFLQNNFGAGPTVTHEIQLKIGGKKFELAVNSLENVIGTAQITHSRGKARYLYEFTFDVSFSLSEERKPEEEFTGKIKVEDVINDLLDDIVYSVSWTKKPPASLVSGIEKALVGSDVHAFILKRMKVFEAEHRKL